MLESLIGSVIAFGLGWMGKDILFLVKAIKKGAKPRFALFESFIYAVVTACLMTVWFNMDGFHFKNLPAWFYVYSYAANYIIFSLIFVMNRFCESKRLDNLVPKWKGSRLETCIQVACLISIMVLVFIVQVTILLSQAYVRQHLS